MDELFKAMEQAVIDGDGDECIRLAEEVIKRGIDPAEALEKGFGSGMEILGEQFERKEVFLPEIMFAEDAMKGAIDTLTPVIEKDGGVSEKKGRVVIGTIQGDVHDIGKNIVALFMNVAGFEVTDLGKDVKVRNFIDTAVKEDADIIAASALMTTTMIYMPEMIKQLKELELRDRFKVMFGGAPVIEDWTKEIGADGYGLTAKEAVQAASSLMEKQRGGNK